VDEAVEDSIGEVGSRLAISVEARPWRSSMISMRSRRWLALRRSGPRSSKTSTLMNDAKDHVLVVSARVDGDRQRVAWRVGRLRRLEAMGLAEERQSGVWAIDPQLEPKLRSMGERGDIMVTMHKIMRQHGMERSAGDFAVFAGARKTEPVIGRVVEVGIADEMSDRQYLVVDGTDGRIHYAETSRLAVHEYRQPA
jgi:type IV secretory pathway VirD2 relaxase